MMKSRPILITILAYLNIFEGIMLGLFYLFVIFSNGIHSIFEMTIAAKILLIIYLFLPVCISYGLLNGKKWGWYGEVFIFAIIALQCILEIFYFIFDNGIKTGEENSWLSALLGMGISLLVIKYLFSKKIRSYFNINLLKRIRS